MSQVSSENPASVLVVDDNPLIVNVLKSLLTSQRYTVYTSNNGLEALEVLKNKPVDIIICDVMMPRMDGYQLHDSVRQQPDLSHIPFIFLTALSDSGEVEMGREAGADDYLVKPFQPKELISIVKGKVNRSKNLRKASEEKLDTFRRKIIHTLSHEFRTPLVAINTGTELLIEQKKSIDESKAAHLLEAIRRGGLRLERLVTDFMLLQQIQAGIAQRVYDNRAEKKNVGQLLQEVIDSHTEFFQQEGFQIKFTDHSRGSSSYIYEPHIRDILWRLISNSVKFRDKQPLIEIFCYVEVNEILIEVRDRGVGIDLDKVKEAMDIFGQIDRDKLEQQGSGLGLAIATRYAEINKGRLDFDKRVGGGSVVTLVLPKSG